MAWKLAAGGTILLSHQLSAEIWPPPLLLYVYRVQCALRVCVVDSAGSPHQSLNQFSARSRRLLLKVGYVSV